MTNARQGSSKTRAGPASAASHTLEHTEQIFNADNPSLWSYFTVWVNKIAHNSAFVFPSRLDYGNGARTSDLNSVWL